MESKAGFVILKGFSYFVCVAGYFEAAQVVTSDWMRVGEMVDEEFQPYPPTKVQVWTSPWVVQGAQGAAILDEMRSKERDWSVRVAIRAFCCACWCFCCCSYCRSCCLKKVQDAWEP